MPYRADGPVERGCFVEEGHRIVFAAAFGREDVIDVSEVARVLPGRFNLRNVGARLQRLYGAAHGFSYGNAPGAGLEVRVSLPFSPGRPLEAI